MWHTETKKGHKGLFRTNIPTREAACCHNCKYGENCNCVVCENDYDSLVCTRRGGHVHRYETCCWFESKREKD